MSVNFCNTAALPSRNIWSDSMRRHNIYWLLAAVGILGSFVLFLFSLDHRNDRNVPGASTTAGQNSLMPESGFANNPAK